MVAMAAPVIDPVAMARIIEAVIPSVARIAVAIIAVIPGVVIARAIADVHAAIAIIVIGAAGQQHGRCEDKPQRQFLELNTHHAPPGVRTIVNGINAWNS
jgi:hypothetical protein